jgi:hypothetical protein
MIAFLSITGGATLTMKYIDWREPRAPMPAAVAQ